MRKLVMAAGLALLCSVSVATWAQGSATLNWVPPDKLTDGRLIAETGGLSGFGVYVDGERVDTAPANVTTYVVDDLGYGSHEFAVTAIRTVNGVEIESDMSNVATKVIQDRVKPDPPTLLEIIVAFLKRLFAHFA